MAKLVGFNGFYSQVVPNWDKINIAKKMRLSHKGSFFFFLMLQFQDLRNHFL